MIASLMVFLVLMATHTSDGFCLVQQQQQQRDWSSSRKTAASAMAVDAAVVGRRRRRRRRRHLAASGEIDFQADSDLYGRGERHLSAVLREGDVVAYQTGTWHVDGVAVGDGASPPTYEYAVVETLQVVWTHNCEHGVIRGLKLTPEQQKGGSSSSGGDKIVRLATTPEEHVVEFGPEQLIARIPVQWSDELSMRKECIPLVDLHENLWKLEEE
jgi:hypothetical protein